MTSRFALWCGTCAEQKAHGRELLILPEGHTEKAALSPFLPLGFAEAAADWLRSFPETGGGSLWRRIFSGSRGRNEDECRHAHVRRRIRALLMRRFLHVGPVERWRWPTEFTGGSLPEGSQAGGEDGPAYRSRLRPDTAEVADAVGTVLAGRLLLGREVEHALGETGLLLDGSIDATLEPLVRTGVVARQAAVGWEGDAWRCRRCGSDQVGFYPCFRCGLDACPQCDTCDSLGRTSACAALYRGATSRPAEQRSKQVLVRLSFALTPQQHEISMSLADATRDGLVWAACGAGKTEVTYEAIRRTVARGGKALFAVPRRDVVEQLGRRLADVFVGAEVVPLYGGTPYRYQGAPIVVATVHQTLRFHHAFDLAVVDEVDAFPLNREPWLLDAVERALVPSGRLILMSATPATSLVERAGRDRWAQHVLPARPHGWPLPLPEFVESRTMRDLRDLRGGEGSHVEVGDSERALHPAHSRSHLPPRTAPQQAPKWAQPLWDLVEESLRRHRRVILFVPQVAMGNALLSALQVVTREQGLLMTFWTADRGSSGVVGKRRGGGGQNGRNGSALGQAPVAAFVHAGDRFRTEKVRAMEVGEIDVLVSTTVLERGITLPFLDAVVFAADFERVWDAASLVQMAGRVGRSSADPTGRVAFLAARTTPAMREARESIARLNRRAEELGLIQKTAGLES